MTPFPRDKDLPAGSTMAATVLSRERLEASSASAIGATLKQLALQHAQPCDMVILCVAPGHGKPFVQGLMEAIAADPTAVVHPTNPTNEAGP